MQHPHVSDTPIQSLTQTPNGHVAGTDNVTGARKRTSLKAALSQAYLRVTSVGKTATRLPNRPKAVSKMSKSSSLETTGSVDSGTFAAQSHDDTIQSTMSIQRQSTRSSGGSRDTKNRSVIVNEDLYEWWGPTDAVIIEGETIHRDDDDTNSGHEYAYGDTQNPSGHDRMKVSLLLAQTQF